MHPGEYSMFLASLRMEKLSYPSDTKISRAVSRMTRRSSCLCCARRTVAFIMNSVQYTEHCSFVKQKSYFSDPRSSLYQNSGLDSKSAPGGEKAQFRAESSDSAL